MSDQLEIMIAIYHLALENSSQRICQAESLQNKGNRSIFDIHFDNIIVMILSYNTARE